MWEKFKSFLKRKDIEVSVKRYGIDALGAMAQCGTCFHVRIYDSGECMCRLFGFYCVLMAVSGDCKTGKSFACADKKCSRHGGCAFFPIYAVCKCDSTGGRLYGIYQYHYGCAAASDWICFTCICMFILFL